MSTLLRLSDGSSTRWVVRRDGVDAELDLSLAELLRLPVTDARARIDAAVPGATAGDAAVLAPVDRQEVWAAGVTYLRSRDGRSEESGHGDMYQRVYDADRPEIFFKSVPERVVPDGAAVGVRTDSGWDVPEPEVGLVLNCYGELVGYVPGNDMSSRSIEGENPLYLPQAKMYERSCALGPGIVPAWEVGEPLPVSLRIERDGAAVFEGTTSTASMKRSFGELADWLFRAMDFPDGAVLLTGTGLVPGAEFTLRADDVVVVDVIGVGTLHNPVAVVGR
ncbi:2-dehydro-3-deoxy-D-arabinonate dehydratase [Haloactinopolyspora alba]|uniref:2-dehydro-3-deoxy-D-arabinonate dehydratase n=1 Tax=Haloactinopolyspora alba TaxID=648780 RepID=A0A2P8E186_9ACTN|nr:fumarylacetoacetate hydrolase family protein [Haloactinopolyspora alba]PSL03209.1 2-dehydro-3-deoxy-D-arabinonate dehydratase [Haloactinopolyspora alba]